MGREWRWAAVGSGEMRIIQAGCTGFRGGVNGFGVREEEKWAPGRWFRKLTDGDAIQWSRKFCGQRRLGVKMQRLLLAVLSLSHPWATEAEVSDRQLGGGGADRECSWSHGRGEVTGRIVWTERERNCYFKFCISLGGDLHNPSSHVGCYPNHTLTLWDLLKSFD